MKRTHKIKDYSK